MSNIKTIEELKQVVDKIVAEHGGLVKIGSEKLTNPDYQNSRFTEGIEISLGFLHDGELFDIPPNPFVDIIVVVIE